MRLRKLMSGVGWVVLIVAGLTLVFGVNVAIGTIFKNFPPLLVLAGWSLIALVVVGLVASAPTLRQGLIALAALIGIPLALAILLNGLNVTFGFDPERHLLPVIFLGLFVWWLWSSRKELKALTSRFWGKRQ